MKRVLLIVVGCLLYIGIASSQETQKEFTIKDVPLATQLSHVFYSDIPTVKKMGNAKSWIAKTFGDYDEVLQLEDKENQRIIIKGGTPVIHEYDASIHSNTAENYTFTMTMDFKEDRYRIRFEDITIMHNLSFGGQRDIMPKWEITLEERFGKPIYAKNDTQDGKRLRNAFYELFVSASKAIEIDDDF